MVRDLETWRSRRARDAKSPNGGEYRVYSAGNVRPSQAPTREEVADEPETARGHHHRPVTLACGYAYIDGRLYRKGQLT